jgi:hypothetical protein
MTNIRQRLALFLRWLAQWLDPVQPPVPLVARDVVDAAIEAVTIAQHIPHSAHYKRAQAFKALRVARPDVRRRDISLAIELALREVSA